MLSPYKLYKHDMKNQRTAVTWGPKGKPYKGSSGTLCYKHANCDWAIHRLPAAVVDREIRKKGGPNIGTKVISRFAEKLGAGSYGREAPRRALMVSSPRWGPGAAPSRHVRKTMPLPKVGHADISKKTYAIAGATVAAGAGAYAYKHRKEIKQKANDLQDRFHQSRVAHQAQRRRK